MQQQIKTFVLLHVWVKVQGRDTHTHIYMSVMFRCPRILGQIRTEICKGHLQHTLILSYDYLVTLLDMYRFACSHEGIWVIKSLAIIQCS